MKKTNLLFGLGTLLCLIINLAFSKNANAVAFKLENSTRYSIRAKVYDHGTWRSYVTVNPGEFRDIATEVERTEHAVVIQMLTNNGWQTVYSNHHGSRLFTRVVQVSENGNSFYFSWWDEHPGCRDSPSTPGTCLTPPGPRGMFNYAVKIGEFLGRAVMVVGA
jgi:hypothetical protein